MSKYTAEDYENDIARIAGENASMQTIDDEAVILIDGAVLLGTVVATCIVGAAYPSMNIDVKLTVPGAAEA